MKKLYIMLFCALQGVCGMDQSAPMDYSAPVIVLDVELITDETPKNQEFAGVLSNISHVPTLLRAFSIWELPKLRSSQTKLLKHANSVKTTMCGATNIIQSALEHVKLNPDEKKVKALVDIGVAPEVKPDGIELVKKLAANNVPLILATHHDAYHLQRYAAYLKKNYGITLKDLFSHGAIVVADPYKSVHEEIAPEHTIVDHPRPSEGYASAIKTLAADKPVMLFDTNEHVVERYVDTLPTYYAESAAEVELHLKNLGYLK